MTTVYTPQQFNSLPFSETIEFVKDLESKGGVGVTSSAEI